MNLQERAIDIISPSYVDPTPEVLSVYIRPIIRFEIDVSHSIWDVIKEAVLWCASDPLPLLNLDH